MVLYRTGHCKEHLLDRFCVNTGQMGNGLCHRFTNLLCGDFAI